MALRNNRTHLAKWLAPHVREALSHGLATMVACILVIGLSMPVMAEDGPDPAEAEKLLKKPDQEADETEPAPFDGDDVAIVDEVWTDPGDLPRFKLEVDGKKYELPLKHTHVEARLVGNVAHVQVKQTYENPLSDPIETVYVFPLPENSAVNDLQMEIGDRLIKADIKEREEARRTYEEAKEKGHTAALLEQERPNIFTQSVANIAPKETIDVTISYVQDLTYDDGQYEFVFPMVVGPRYIPGAGATGEGGQRVKSKGKKSGTGWSPDTAEVGDASRITPPIVGAGMRTGNDVSIHMTIEPGLAIKEFNAPTHKVAAEQLNSGGLELTLAELESIPNRDFVLRYKVAGDEPVAALMTHKGDKGGHFTFIIQPPDLDIEKLVGKREFVFIVDVSGSMRGKPLALAKDAMRSTLKTLRPEDTFNVIVFASREDMLWPKPRPANDTNLKETLEFLDGLQGSGGTEMNNAIDAVFAMDGDLKRHRYVFFMTDGLVGNEDGILDKAQTFTEQFPKKRKGKKSRIFSFGVGSSPNRYLLESLAEAGEGASLYASNREDPTRAVNRFFALVDHPIITDIEIDWGPIESQEVYPSDMPDLFLSQPLVLHGQYTGSGEGKIVVKGKVEGDDITLEVPVNVESGEHGDPVQDTLWARAKVADLQRDLWAGFNQKVVDTVTKLGLEYNLVTAYTSLVAVDYERTVEGDLKQITQPVDAAEDVNMDTAAPPGAILGQAGGKGQSTATAAAPVEASANVNRKRVRRRPSPKKTLSRSQDKEIDESEESEPAVKVASIKTSAVKKEMKAARKKMQMCYEPSLDDNPKLSGTIKIEMTFDKNGKLVDFRISQDDLGERAITDCISRVLRRVTIDAPGKRVKVTYPFKFAP